MKLILTSKIFSFFLLLCCLSINNIVNAGKGGGAGRSVSSLHNPCKKRYANLYMILFRIL